MNKFKCPNCGKTISIIWLFFGRESTKCERCGTMLKFNNYRRVAYNSSAFLVVLVPQILVRSYDILIYNIWLTAIIITSLVLVASKIILACLLPGQFSCDDEKE